MVQLLFVRLSLVNRGRQKTQRTSNLLGFQLKQSLAQALKKGCLPQGIGSRVNQVLMKANTTKNVTSVVMIAIVSLLMTQTILVGVQTAEINENGVLLL